LSSSWVSLIFSLVNERTGKVASERGFTTGVLSELGLKIEEESLWFGWRRRGRLRMRRREMGCCGKWFTKLESVNHFPKNVKAFWSNEIIFGLTTILRHNKHRKMQKLYFENYFTSK
jgi:hypothetical protein